MAQTCRISKPSASVLFFLKVKHEQETTDNRRQRLCIWSHFYHQGNLWHPIHVRCLMALTVFRLGRLHSGCVFCCKRSFVLFVFLITCSTCISNHKANQWLKSIHTLRGCNKCWISVLLKKVTSTLHFFKHNKLFNLFTPYRKQFVTPNTKLR